MNSFSFSAEISAGSNPILSISDFSIEKGKITVLFGESGIGKSLISKSVFGISDPAQLSIKLNEITYPKYITTEQAISFRKNGFFVLQEPSSQFNQSMTINSQMSEADLGEGDTQSQILNSLWNSDQWKSLLNLYPQSFRPSGGEKQRFLLAMALKKIDILTARGLLKPETLFVFDEPSGSLDNGFRNAFLEQLVLRFNKTPFTILLITHDYTVIPWFNEHASGIKNKVTWLELTKSDSDELLSRPFISDEFMTWQSKLDPLGNITGEQVSSLNSGVVCHGRKLTFHTGKKQLEALSLKSGVLTYLKAASGVGKTTVARILMGLYPSQNLVLTLCGHDFSETSKQQDWKSKIWGNKAGLAFQLADEALNPVSTVKQVFTALRNPKLKSSEQIISFLQPVFLKKLDDSFLSRQVRFLSGGQKQRLNLMRSIASEPRVLILDEPLNGVDFKTIKMFTGILENLLQKGTTILLISHNEDIFDRLTFEENRVFLKAELEVNKSF